jgi:hypothetical protein
MMRYFLSTLQQINKSTLPQCHIPASQYIDEIAPADQNSRPIWSILPRLRKDAILLINESTHQQINQPLPTHPSPSAMDDARYCYCLLTIQALVLK